MYINEAGVSSASVRYIFTPSSFAEQMFYYPTRIGHYYCDSRYHFSYQNEIAIDPGHLFNYMIFFVKEGQLDITVDGEQKQLLNRGIVIFDCQKPYEYRAASEQLEFYWLLFNGGQSTLFYEKMLQMYGRHVVEETGGAERLFVHLLKFCESGERVSERTYSEHIYLLLCQLLVSEHGKKDELSKIIEEAVAFIDDNLDQKLSVDSVAAHVGLSTSYFGKQFHLRTGYPPYEYLVFQRIQKAKELLVSTNMTAQQIGFEVGYPTQDNFFRSFKKKVGVSPSTFRKFPV